jgi:hypothetical protein
MIPRLDDVIGPSPLSGEDIAQHFGGSKFTAEIRRRRRLQESSGRESPSMGSLFFGTMPDSRRTL